MVGVLEKKNTGLTEVISDKKDEALTEKEKRMQGLERSSCQYQKTGIETCPEGDDEAVGTSPVSFRLPEGGAWSSRAEIGVDWWRHVEVRG